MTKLEGTKLLIDNMTELESKGYDVNPTIISTTMLIDIAKSLAIIADKLCEIESIKD